MPLPGIGINDKIIVIEKGQTILGHTVEFIGAKNGFTTMMKARSSIGRNMLSICKCAGWGDVGYFNRWTLEITNHSNEYDIILVCGRKVGQVVFFPVNKLISEEEEKFLYHKNGKYQETENIITLIEFWKPEMMLPKMYKDKNVVFDSDCNFL